MHFYILLLCIILKSLTLFQNNLINIIIYFFDFVYKLFKFYIFFALFYLFLILLQANQYAEKDKFWYHAVLIHLITSLIR